ncbi:MAG: 30S ribosomal protein S12 methylthiotransferase RimO [Actinomycetota bacterium]|nr:30S ribosomal protein S12 methylthiotransferase RimO [Actinomycetota bacterium]
MPPEGGWMRNGRYWLQTLGCPKNQVDSEKLAGLLEADGFVPSTDPGDADLVVVNTCAFIDDARRESIDAILELADSRRRGARLVVTGCLAERYGDELAAALPEVDLVAGFGRQPVPPALPRLAPAGAKVELRARRPVRSAGSAGSTPSTSDSFDLLSLPRPPSRAPWAYVKVAEGCDRRCGFCAIPSFRGPQRSRTPAEILAEVRRLASDDTMPVKEVVLVAQDLASYGKDRAAGPGRVRDVGREAPLVPLVRSVADVVARTRLLYLYPSGLTGELVDAVLATGVPYFDLSLQHVSRPLLARMRRWGDGERFLERIAAIRRAEPLATFRSSFILGYPGETEEDHDALLGFLEAAQLDWAGFFTFSREDGTFADRLAEQVPGELALERLRECAELQDAITARRRDQLVGEVREVLVEAPGRGRTVHEAPEIDGVVRLPASVPVGSLTDVVLIASLGTDLVGELAATVGRDAPGAAPVSAEAGR